MTYALKFNVNRWWLIYCFVDNNIRVDGDICILDDKFLAFRSKLSSKYLLEKTRVQQLLYISIRRITLTEIKRNSTASCYNNNIDF